MQKAWALAGISGLRLLGQVTRGGSSDGLNLKGRSGVESSSSSKIPVGRSFSSSMPVCVEDGGVESWKTYL
jgi:hypothetical protein